MSAGFCLHCGLKLPEDGDYWRQGDAFVHMHCADAYIAYQAAAAKRPPTQLDRIEGLLMAIRDRYSL